MHLSTFTKIKIHQKSIHIKRDDLLSTEYPGNKFRKLHKVKEILKSHDHDTLISAGGTQSNSMLALSFLAKEFGLKYQYYTYKVPKYLMGAPCGNFARSLENGMVFYEVASPLEYVRGRKFEMNEFYVPMGGMSPLAELGMVLLAEEIVEEFIGHVDPIKVFLPSGTGTTAFYLQKHLSNRSKNIQVVTVPCSGTPSYLFSQFEELASMGTDFDLAYPKENWPVILPCSNMRFATPKKSFLDIYHQFKEAGIEIDLIYAPRLWSVLFKHWDLYKNDTIVYIHTGGTSGNQSQLERYKKKFGKLD